MRHFLLISTATLAAVSTLTSCASVSEKIPVIKVERKAPARAKTTQVIYENPQAISDSELSSACDNVTMRARAADTNLQNDRARILVLEDSNNSSSIVSDTLVDCGQFHQNQRHVQRHVQRQVQAPVPTTPYIPASSNPSISYPSQSGQSIYATQTHSNPATTRYQTGVRTVQSGYSYQVKKGDTLYRIALNHCTTVDAIAAINAIHDPARISTGQLLNLPNGHC